MRKARKVAQYCGKCGEGLTDDNWFPSFKKMNAGTCRQCANRQLPILFCIVCGTVLEEMKCIPCENSQVCTRCGVVLGQDNWGVFNRNRHLLRCNTCHYEITGAWQKAHPESNRARSARWHESHPEYKKDYYWNNKERHQERMIEYLWKFKNEAIDKLGGQCVVCGITDLRLLDINHLNGREDDKGKFGMDMYTIILDGTRSLDDLDVRCCNHNRLYEYECGRRKVPTWFVHEADAPGVNSEPL